MSEGVLDLAGALLALAGAVLILSGAIGLLRLPDFYCRSHSPAKAATLGLILVAGGSILRYGAWDAAFWLEKVVLMLFVLLTVPVTTQMLVRGAAARGVPHVSTTQGTPEAGPIERLGAGGPGKAGE